MVFLEAWVALQCFYKPQHGVYARSLRLLCRKQRFWFKNTILLWDSHRLRLTWEFIKWYNICILIQSSYYKGLTLMKYYRDWDLTHWYSILCNKLSMLGVLLVFFDWNIMRMKQYFTSSKLYTRAQGKSVNKKQVPQNLLLCCTSQKCDKNARQPSTGNSKAAFFMGLNTRPLYPVSPMGW